MIAAVTAVQGLNESYVENRKSPQQLYEIFVQIKNVLYTYNKQEVLYHLIGLSPDELKVVTSKQHRGKNLYALAKDIFDNFFPLHPYNSYGLKCSAEMSIIMEILRKAEKGILLDVDEIC